LSNHSFPTPHKLFEKSLIKNFTKVVFCLASCLKIGLAETPLRGPRQDDGAASGSRGIFARVKPDKHSPGRRDGVEAVLYVAGRRQTLVDINFYSMKFLIKLFSKSLRVVGKERLLNKFHNAFGEIREDDSSFLQTLFI
jgi:hypothetical protein